MTRQVLISTSLWVCLACGGEATTAPAAATTTPGSSPQYQIVLHRPLAAGNKFRVVVDARQQVDGDETNAGAAQSQSTVIARDFQLALAGTVTIREVDAEGRATSALLQIEQFKTNDGRELVPTGTSIDAVLGQGKFTMMVNGEPRPDLQKPLQLAFPLHRPGSPLGDELFGSKTPRQVGDSWAFSKSSVAESMADEGYAVRETGISGDTRLMGTTSVNGVECLELASKLVAEQATIDDEWEIQGVGTGKIESTIKLVVPTDTALPVAMEEATTRGEFGIHLAGGSASTTTALTLTRYRRALYTRVNQ